MAVGVADVVDVPETEADAATVGAWVGKVVESSVIVAADAAVTIARALGRKVVGDRSAVIVAKACPEARGGDAIAAKRRPNKGTATYIRWIMVSHRRCIGAPNFVHCGVYVTQKSASNNLMTPPIASAVLHGK